MAPERKTWAIDNPIPSRRRVREEQNAASANAPDQTLLKALQDLIVRVMDPKQKNEMNQIHLAAEAGKFIGALQEFISSIVVRSQPGAQNIVEVSSLDDEGAEDDEKQKQKQKQKEKEKETDQFQEEGFDDAGTDDESPSIATLLSSSSTARLLSRISSSDSYHGAVAVVKNSNSVDLATPQKPKPSPMDKFLLELKEHIFNMMPIRLLCFEVYGSKFRIVLLERGAVYARLASELPGKISEEEFRPRPLIFMINQFESESDVIKRLVSKYSGYAILSHTWLRTASGEVTYGDWKNGRLDAKDPGYRKLVTFCKAAWNDYGLAFGWMDTVCINKESSSELDESIRSMYNWYSRSAVCITYLAETKTLSNMHLDPWFTRGWTLQELLAPEVIKFYNGGWKVLIDDLDNDKMDAEIMDQIRRATTISKDELRNIRLKASISRRMQLAATREVTREEDMAYSLMGIFDITISTSYGEGAPHAFYRLLQEILNSSKDVLDILNWAGTLPSSRPYNSLILPPHPKYYVQRSSNHTVKLRRPIEPLALTHLGLRVPFILMPGLDISRAASKIGEPHASGDYNAIVTIPEPLGLYSSIPKTYSLLDKQVSGSDGLRDNMMYQMTFAVFNFSGGPNGIYIPKTCIALGLRCTEQAGKVSTAGNFGIIRTHEPIVFELSRTTPDETNNWCWQVKPDELAKHGMQMISLYL